VLWKEHSVWESCLLSPVRFKELLSVRICQLPKMVRSFPITKGRTKSRNPKAVMLTHSRQNHLELYNRIVITSSLPQIPQYLCIYEFDVLSSTFIWNQCKRHIGKSDEWHLAHGPRVVNYWCRHLNASLHGADLQTPVTADPAVVYLPEKLINWENPEHFWGNL
jgi:hypothetical protein